jgi:hypothetical protein
MAKSKKLATFREKADPVGDGLRRLIAAKEEKPDRYKDLRELLLDAQTLQEQFWDAIRSLEAEMQIAFNDDGFEVEAEEIAEGQSLEDLCELYGLKMEDSEPEVK